MQALAPTHSPMVLVGLKRIPRDLLESGVKRRLEISVTMGRRDSRGLRPLFFSNIFRAQVLPQIYERLGIRKGTFCLRSAELSAKLHRPAYVVDVATDYDVEVEIE